METIFLFSAVIDESLQHIIQLIILCIPLVMVPIIVQSSRSLGSIGKIADRVQKGIGLDKGLDKVRGGVGKRAAAYGRLGASGVGVGYKTFRKSNVGQDMFGKYDENKAPGRIRRGVRGARKAVVAARALDQAALSAREEAKKGKTAEIQERAAQFGIGKAGEAPGVIGQALHGVGGNRYTAAAAYEVDKARKERIASIEAQWRISNTDADTIATAFKSALASDDHDTVSAAISRLPQMGAYGAAQLADSLNGTQIASPEMRTTVSSMLNEGSVYGTVVGKEGGVAKGGFEGDRFVLGGVDAATGESKGLSGLSPDQLAGQTAKSLKRALKNADGTDSGRRAIDTINPQTAAAVMSNPALRAKLADNETENLLQGLANQYQPPNTP